MGLINFKTVDDGEQVMVWNHLGQGKVVSGPARLTLWRSRVQELPRYRAGQGEYLFVQMKEGEKIVRVGPCSM